jgi:putative membrane protein
MKSAILVGVLLVTGTAAAQQQPPSAQIARADQAFLNKAVRDSLTEIALGRLASQKGQREEVKKFGQAMVDSHTAASGDLKALALRRNITWPNDLDAEGKAVHARLTGLSGVAFDRAYMQVAVNDHRLIADDLERAMALSQDAEIKAWAAEALISIEEHIRTGEDVTRAISPPGSTQ